MRASVVLLPGRRHRPRGGGRGRRVLEHRGRAGSGTSSSFAEHLARRRRHRRHGRPLPAETLAACQAADAVLLGAVGGPKWDDPRAKVRPEQGLLGLRRALGLYANLRPVRVHPALADASPLKAERLAGVDVLFVRELTGGLYFGQPRLREKIERRRARGRHARVHRRGDPPRRAPGVPARAGRRKHVHLGRQGQRARVVAPLARGRRRGRGRVPDVTLEHQLVDSAAMRLITDAAPRSTSSSPRTCSATSSRTRRRSSPARSACCRAPRWVMGVGLYEPIHGSAPDIAGRGIANPLGTISWRRCSSATRSASTPPPPHRARRRVRAAEAGLRTADLGGTLGTDALTRAVVERL